MAFEIREKDLLARIGKLRTKSGTVETPLLFPVVNPSVQPISPRKIREEFGFEALITNAYILKRRFQNEPIERGLHAFLDFDGTVMTDSGAYQILVYGDVEVNPKEIVEYQEQIGTDIATILDWPTGWKVSRAYAEQTVDATLKRAKELDGIKTRDDILWVGPVQGGRYLDLVAKSAARMAKLPFQIHALGSPTEVMESYRFDVLTDMIMTAKASLPIDRPLHLFGAGHPFMFSFAVALGCDLFDSAAYALYARENRYMTEYGTWRLNELDYFPCTCPKCSKTAPNNVSELPQKEKQTFLAEHNLYVCAAELKRVKQAIRDGRMWEYMELRAHSHPALLQALRKFKKYEEQIERNGPAVKNSGLLFFSHIGLARPEVVRYRKRMAQRYSPPSPAKILLLVPQARTKPFHKSPEFREYVQKAKRLLKESANRIHVCFYEAPFGVVPVEIDEVYPLSQHETAMPLDKETVDYVASEVANHIKRTRYERVVLFDDHETWNDAVLRACRNVCRRRKIKFQTVRVRKTNTDQDASKQSQTD